MEIRNTAISPDVRIEPNRRTIYYSQREKFRQALIDAFGSEHLDPDDVIDNIGCFYEMNLPSGRTTYHRFEQK